MFKVQLHEIFFYSSSISSCPVLLLACAFPVHMYCMTFTITFPLPVQDNDEQLVVVEPVLVGDISSLEGGGNTVCEYCHKDLRTPSLLERHITVHTKEKKYVCMCGRGYTRPDRSRKHMEVCALQNNATNMALNRA